MVGLALRERGLPVDPCGLNADWSCRAWCLAPGVYLLDEERGRLRDGIPLFSVVRRVDDEHRGEAEITPITDDDIEHTLEEALFAYAESSENCAPRSAVHAEVAADAEAAFWEVVKAAYPEAETGDFLPEDAVDFARATRRAVRAWVLANGKAGAR